MKSWLLIDLFPRKTQFFILSQYHTLFTFQSSFVCLCGMSIDEHIEEAMKQVNWGEWTIKDNMLDMHRDFFGEIEILRGQKRRDYEVHYYQKRYSFVVLSSSLCNNHCLSLKDYLRNRKC